MSPYPKGFLLGISWSSKKTVLEIAGAVNYHLKPGQMLTIYCNLTQEQKDYIDSYLRLSK